MLLWLWVAVVAALIGIAAAGARYRFKGGDRKKVQFPDSLGRRPSDFDFVRTTVALTGPHNTEESSKRERQLPTAKSAANDEKKPLKQPPASNDHLWLLAVKQDEIVSERNIEVNFGLKPVLGWPLANSIVLAAFTSPERLKFRKDGVRITIGSDDFIATQIAAISRQAVPIFTSVNDGWQFKGFARVSRPASQSVACRRLSELPPELVQLASDPDGT